MYDIFWESFLRNRLHYSNFENQTWNYTASLTYIHVYIFMSPITFINKKITRVTTKYCMVILIHNPVNSVWIGRMVWIGRTSCEFIIATQTQVGDLVSNLSSWICREIDFWYFLNQLELDYIFDFLIYLEPNRTPIGAK